MTTPLTPAQKAQLNADLEQRERALRAQLEALHALLVGDVLEDRGRRAPLLPEIAAHRGGGDPDRHGACPQWRSWGE